MTFREKISKILKHNTLDLNSVEDISAKTGVNASTIRKGMGDQDGMKLENEKKIVEGLGINWKWWDVGEEPIFEENGTVAINNDEPTISEEKKLIATLEKAVAIIEKDNENLWKQNATLLALVEKLTTGGLAGANKN